MFTEHTHIGAVASPQLLTDCLLPPPPPFNDTTPQVFTEHTHIAAVRTTGNVYCWEALEQLCLKPKSLRDLLTGARWLAALAVLTRMLAHSSLPPAAACCPFGGPFEPPHCALLILQTSRSPRRTSSTCRIRST